MGHMEGRTRGGAKVGRRGEDERGYHFILSISLNILNKELLKTRNACYKEMLILNLHRICSNRAWEFSFGCRQFVNACI